MEEKPKKRIPKVKISISISRSVWEKITEIVKLSEASPSSIINHVLKEKDSLSELKEYYSNPDNKKKGAGKEE